MEILLTAIVPIAGIAIMLVTALTIAPQEVRTAIFARVFPPGGPQAMRGTDRHTA